MPSEGNKMQLNKEEYKNFKQIVNIFYNEEIAGINEDKEKIKKEGTIKIEPRIFYDKFSGDMKIEFKIGNKKISKSGWVILPDFLMKFSVNHFQTNPHLVVN